MGFFNSLKYNDKEQMLLDLYTAEFQKDGSPEASKIVADLLDEAIKESDEVNAPSNIGDMILEKEKVDENTHQTLEKKRKEGVRDEDIKWWWNLDNIERTMMLKVDNFHRLSLFIKCREKDGLSEKQAGVQMWKFYPMYGNPEDTTNAQGDDRPLFIELRDRINIYIEKRAQSDHEKFKTEIEQSTTFNALIRKEIRAGKL